MKASLVGNLQSFILRSYASSSLIPVHGMIMVPRSLFHRLQPVHMPLQAISTSKQFSQTRTCYRLYTDVEVELVRSRFWFCSRSYSTQPSTRRSTKAKPDSSTGSSKSLTESSGDSGAVTLSLGEKVKENAKTGGYGIVILMGIAVTGAMLWFILSELFSSDSPNNIYTHAFKLCKLSPEVQDAMGTPIKCHGEESRRGWRRHVSHVEFFQGSTKFLRMRFYIEGPFNKGTVHVEKKKEGQGKYEYSYLVVDVEGYPPRRIDVHF